jgi:hypothetical protein
MGDWEEDKLHSDGFGRSRDAGTRIYIEEHSTPCVCVVVGGGGG